MSMLWLVWCVKASICLGFCIFRCEEAFPRDGLTGMGVLAEVGRWVTAQKWLIGLLEGLCSREGKSGDGFLLVIRITRWNQMHIGSAPWNNELVIVHWEDKWCRIIALVIGCRFDLAVAFGLLGKEVDRCINLRVEVWASWFPCCGCKNHIHLFTGYVPMCRCICGYCKYHNELCYKSPWAVCFF